MFLPSHPLLLLLDASKNDLKASLTNYIDLMVENQFGQLRNRIVAMIESGQIVLGDVNAPLSTQSNEHLSTDQIFSARALLANRITTEPTVIKRECLDTSSSTTTPINLDCDDVKEEYNDDDDFEDEGEYMSDCDECEDCLNGICSQSAPLVNNQQSIASTSSKCKITTESSEAVLKKVKSENVVQIHQQEGTETKKSFVIFELNCTEPGCEMIFTNYQLWKEHLCTAHGQIAYAQLENSARLNQNGQTEYACPEYDSVVKSHRSLINHWRHYHQEGKFQCSLCTFGANLMFEVLNHRQSAHRSNKFQCIQEGCNLTFKTNQILQEHSRIHGNEKPYACIWENCGASFKHLKSAIQHVRTLHLDLPPTVKEQKELNIIDHRDPKLYVRLN